MAIAIRDDVAKGKPYNQLIERLLAEHRQVVVYSCPRDNCARSVFVFYEGHTSLVALEHHVLLLLKRTHPEHDPVYALNEDLPVEGEKLEFRRVSRPSRYSAAVLWAKSNRSKLHALLCWRGNHFLSNAQILGFTSWNEGFEKCIGDLHHHIRGYWSPDDEIDATCNSLGDGGHAVIYQ